MTLAELAITVGLLGGLGLVASRVGLSAIPAYLLAGILLGPNEPKALSLVQPSEVTDFVAEIGLVFLLFFLGLEFSPGRLIRSGRHVLYGGAADLAVNGAIGVLLGLVLFGPSLAAVALAAAVYVSSSAIAVKALADFRRLADDETDLVLAILLFEDVVVAVLLGFVAAGGGGLAESAGVGGSALMFVAASLVAGRVLGATVGRLLARLDLEFFLLAVFGFVFGMAALAQEIGVSDAVGALMAGVVLSESGVRQEIEERFFALRDVFAALFFFVFGLSIDLSALDDLGWVLASEWCSPWSGRSASASCRRARRADAPAGSERRGRARRSWRVHHHRRPARSGQRCHRRCRPREDRSLCRALRARSPPRSASC